MTRGPGRRRISVRSSPIHGRGVYALTDLAAGERLLEYRGEVISWETAHERFGARPDGDDHTTYFFDLGNGSVIDGERGGNSARFLNHGCEPNCEALDDNGRIVIDLLGDVAAGQELLLNYALVLDDPDDPDQRAHYVCACSAASCRGTMLAPSPSD